MMHKEWYPAIYARLSDDDGRTGVSLSIENQLNILRRFVQENGWHTPKEFYDDDKTGTNFNRKGFQDMYAEAQNGNINVIIIKDTSRFGRNWVKSGVYFEAIEEMGVRFISIQEGIDTIDPKCPALKMLPFYFVFNEWHSETTSTKIRTVRRHNAEEGKHQANSAPYGYVKDPNNKYKLILDPYAANIVKRIYNMRLQKNTICAIARKLNSENILSPSEYKAAQNNVENKRSRMGKWSANTVRFLLGNPVYCGDVVYGKFARLNYKNHKQIRKPEDEWIVAKDMHEPIVSREDWQKCFDMLAAVDLQRSLSSGEMAIFSGLLKCQDCGYNMRRTGMYYYLKSGEKKMLLAYNCGAYGSMGETACCSHYILDRDLQAIVLDDIRSKAEVIMKHENAARDRFYDIKSQSNKTRLNGDKTTLKKANKRISELDVLIQAAFEKMVLNAGSATTFENLVQKYEAEKEELTESVRQLTISIAQQTEAESDVDKFIALMKKYVNIREIDRAIAVELIDHIEVGAKSIEPREITIYYNFVGNIE